jgi:hypothetical protein
MGERDARRDSAQEEVKILQAVDFRQENAGLTAATPER